jgi:molybdopterin-guanine dinucleotide biosynthesis protein A
VKTIVIAGARAKVGKTTLANEIVALIPGSRHVKIGHGPPKKGKTEAYYHVGTAIERILKDHGDAACLVIESNAILRSYSPDLAVYLTADSPKESARDLKNKADIVRGADMSSRTIEALSRRLAIQPVVIKKIAWLAGARPKPATAIVLTGGRSSRMGTDKAALNVNGATALEHLIDILKLHFGEIIVSASSKRELPQRDIRVVHDRTPGQGPLMGIYSALLASHTDMNFVIGCDIPNVYFPLVYTLFSAAEDADIAVPSFTDGFTEPLFAVYRQTAIPCAEKALAHGRRRISLMFDTCRTSIVKVRGDVSWYVNLNTRHDYDSYVQQRGWERVNHATVRGKQ